MQSWAGARACDYDQPIILFKKRLYDPKTRMDPKGDSRGFMIWLTPRKRS